MKIGDRVIVHARWSSFRGMKGTVTSTRPHLMVHFDDLVYAIRIEEPSVVLDEPSAVNLTGAE